MAFRRDSPRTSGTLTLQCGPLFARFALLSCTSS